MALIISQVTTQGGETLSAGTTSGGNYKKWEAFKKFGSKTFFNERISGIMIETIQTMEDQGWRLVS